MFKIDDKGDTKFREFEHGGHRKIEAESEKKPDVGPSETGAEADPEKFCYNDTCEIDFEQIKEGENV